MKPLSALLLFLCIVIPMGIMFDSKQDYKQNQNRLLEQYTNDFQSAVDDTVSYLGRFESQQSTSSIRYQREKQINTDMDMINVFFQNLALKYSIENNPVAMENLKIHMPGMVIFKYNGYVLVTLEDGGVGKEIKTVLWAQRPYTYTLANGNILYFTLDDQATVYDVQNNGFLQGSYDELRTQTNLLPLKDLSSFREVRQTTIVNNVESDLSGVINRHNELVKRLDLNIQFTIPRVTTQSIEDVGFMAFVQGYPVPGGETFTGYAFGGGSVVKRKSYIGTIDAKGKHIAYGEKCVPENATIIEQLFDPKEAVSKGYFINDCF